LLDDSTKTVALFILVVNHETVATTGRAEVACDVLRAVVGCGCREGIQCWEGGAQGTPCTAAWVAMADLQIHWDFWIGDQSAGF
jgi:hypothetical protein